MSASTLCKLVVLTPNFISVVVNLFVAVIVETFAKIRADGESGFVSKSSRYVSLLDLSALVKPHVFGPRAALIPLEAAFSQCPRSCSRPIPMHLLQMCSEHTRKFPMTHSTVRQLRYLLSLVNGIIVISLLCLAAPLTQNAKFRAANMLTSTTGPKTSKRPAYQDDTTHDQLPSLDDADDTSDDSSVSSADSNDPLSPHKKKPLPLRDDFTKNGDLSYSEADLPGLVDDKVIVMVHAEVLFFFLYSSFFFTCFSACRLRVAKVFNRFPSQDGGALSPTAQNNHMAAATNAKRKGTPHPSKSFRTQSEAPSDAPHRPVTRLFTRAQPRHENADTDGKVMSPLPPAANYLFVG